MKNQHVPSFVVAAVAAFVAGSTLQSCKSSHHDSVSIEKHACKGMNSCKGQGGCATDKNACKGQNACKGHGGCNTEKNACSGKNGCSGKGGCPAKTKG